MAFGTTVQIPKLLNMRVYFMLSMTDDAQSATREVREYRERHEKTYRKEEFDLFEICKELS